MSINRINVTAAAAALLSISTTFAEAVETLPVEFSSAGSPMAGTLHLPDGYEAGTRLPLIVVTGAWTSVKEQMPDTYARALAKRGYAALTFDFRGWGQSGDLPAKVRYREDPTAKIEDIKAAFAFAGTLPEADPSRINGLGICASAGYMVDAAAGNPAVKRVGLVAPWLQNRAIVEAVYGGEAGVAALVAIGREADAKGGEVIPAAGPVGAEGVLMPLGGYYFDETRGAIPQYDNKWDQASWQGWLSYFPADHAPAFDKPLAIVHSEAAAIPQGVKAFLAGYKGTAELTWLDGIDQFTFYDQTDAVMAATDIVAQFFAAE